MIERKSHTDSKTGSSDVLAANKGAFDMNTLQRLGSVALILGLLSGLPGCSTGDAEVAVSDVTPFTTESPCTPVRIAVLQDKTGSSEKTRTEQLSVDRVEPLLEVLQACGGELRVGFFTDDSNYPLVDVHVESPPVLDRGPDTDGTNAIQRVAEERKQEQRQKGYAQARDRWERQVAQRLAGFRDRLRPLLADAPDARTTDIVGALRRADLFLAEPVVGLSGEPRRYVLAITDGLHNTTDLSSAEPLQSDATIVLVNGEGEMGIFADLAPTRFESLDAALRFIVDDAVETSP